MLRVSIAPFSLVLFVSKNPSVEGFLVCRMSSQREGMVRTSACGVGGYQRPVCWSARMICFASSLIPKARLGWFSSMKTVNFWWTASE